MKAAIYTVATIVFLVGILFKIQHYPGAGAMIILSITAFAIAFLKLAYDIRKSIFALIPVLFTLFMICWLIKLQHWPLGPYFPEISRFLYLLSLPILFVFRGVNVKGSHPKVSARYLIIGLLFGLEFIATITIRLFPDLVDPGYDTMLTTYLILTIAIVVLIISTLRLPDFRNKLNQDWQMLIFLLILQTVATLVIPPVFLLGVKPTLSQSFQTINEGLDRTVNNLDQRNQVLYEAVIAQSSANEKQAELVGKVDHLRSTILELDALIEELKRELIITMDVEQSDDMGTKTAKRILLAEGNASILFKELSGIKESIMATFEVPDSLILPILSYQPLINEEEATWEMATFNNLPSIVSVASLSQIQSELQNAERVVLVSLLEHLREFDEGSDQGW